jgi:hypothetical protein
VAVIDSLRGKWTMSTSHNPVQNNDLREASNKENKMIGIAAKALADSGGLPHVSYLATRCFKARLKPHQRRMDIRRFFMPHALLSST